MRHRLLWIVGLLVLVVTADARAEQTIVFMRHGEKPSGGYGQLTCQGFNRALALHDVLVAKFGKPDYLYAPSPAFASHGQRRQLSTDVRPLATIEPTAVRLGHAGQDELRIQDITTVQAALVTSTKANTTIFVAWEHLESAEAGAEHHEQIRRPRRRARVGFDRLRQPVRGEGRSMSAATSAPGSSAIAKD